MFIWNQGPLFSLKKVNLIVETSNAPMPIYNTATPLTGSLELHIQFFAQEEKDNKQLPETVKMKCRKEARRQGTNKDAAW